MERKKVYLGTNTKMFKTVSETETYLRELDALTRDLDRGGLELFVIPSFPALERARKTVPGERIKLGAQNMCWEDRGQFTGEVSPLLLKELGMDLVELGHSERRHIFGETDRQENLKVRKALEHGLLPLLCIGETGEQKETGVSDETLATQLKVGLHGVTPQDARRLWVAYEPVWAIGVSGVPAAPEYVQARHGAIRGVLCALFGESVGREVPILHGGSVNLQNAVELIGLQNVDGLFIGRSAWDAENFSKIIREVLAAL